MATEVMTDDEFADRFDPIANHLNPHASFDWGKGYGTLFETYGDELEFVKRQSADKVWTLVSGDESDAIVSGFHFVNRIGYFVTSVAVPTDTDIYVELETIE